MTASTVSQHESLNTPPGDANERRGDTNVLTWSFE
jgi:hypothetical protein